MVKTHPQYPDLEEIFPGLYVSTDTEQSGKLTQEFAGAMRTHGSHALANLIEEAIRKQEQREAAGKSR